MPKTCFFDGCDEPLFKRGDVSKTNPIRCFYVQCANGHDLGYYLAGKVSEIPDGTVMKIWRQRDPEFMTAWDASGDSADAHLAFREIWKAREEAIR